MEMMSKAMVAGLLEMHEEAHDPAEARRIDENIGRLFRDGALTKSGVDHMQGFEGNRKQRRAAKAVARKNARRVTA